MLEINPQYITDSTGKKISVVLSMKEFTAVMKELENTTLCEKVKTSNNSSASIDAGLDRIKTVLDDESETEDIIDNIKTGLQEVRLFKKGKLATTPAKDFLNEL